MGIEVNRNSITFTTCEHLSGNSSEEVNETTDRIQQNTRQHAGICNELNSIFESKNRDYGDSFHNTFVEEGFAMGRIRLTDKLERFKTLSRQQGSPEVTDESMRDTLLDLANYAIMLVMEMDKQSKQ